MSTRVTMPKCAFKSCKNNYRKNNLSVGVSYFRFPGNPFRCAKWTSIVARERGDEFYKPAKNSVICSDHFDKLHISGNTTRRRLAKIAAPLQPLPLSSGLDIKPKATNQDQEDQKHREEQAEHNSLSTSPDASLSDLIPVFESPIEKFLKKQLLTARKIINNKSKQIQKLQKRNKRLDKKIHSLKNIISLLKENKK